MSDNAIALRDGPSQRGTALRKIDEGPDAKPIAEQLRDAISEQAVRVIELFREWDEDGSGNISNAELHKALPLLGLDVPPAAIDELFASWDPDGSGSVELNELNKQLRRGSAVHLAEALQPGAAGEISTSTDNAIALRTGGPSQRGTALRRIDLDEGPNAKPIQEQLRNAITEQAVRVIELFREWDEDEDGVITKKEFRRAMPLLGLEVPKAEVDKLFDSWDADKTGSITLPELTKLLRRGSAIEIDDALKAGAAGEIELESKAKIALRTGGPSQRGTALRKIDLDEGPDAKPIQEQLRNAITEQAVRVFELFREWDEDGPARNSLWRPQAAAQFSDAAFYAPQVTAPCRRRSSAAPCPCSAWRCRRRRSTSSSTAGLKATARSPSRS